MSDASQKPVILLVDDSRSILETAKAFLGNDFVVKVARNGFSALAAVQDYQPDLIFMDVVMPELDGYNTCLAIKANAQLSHIPIIILSSKDSPFDRAYGETMGCDDYLTKPFEERDLRAKIAQHLRAR